MRTSKRVHAFSARTRYAAKSAVFVRIPGFADQNHENLLKKSVARANSMAPGLQKDDGLSDGVICAGFAAVHCAGNLFSDEVDRLLEPSQREMLEAEFRCIRYWRKKRANQGKGSG
jgi:hypothetical protein